MSIGNVAAVFAPNLVRAREAKSEHLEHMGPIIQLIAFMISEPITIFGECGQSDRSGSVPDKTSWNEVWCQYWSDVL